MNELSILTNTMNIEEINKLETFLKELWGIDTELSVESVNTGLFVNISEAKR